MSEDDPTTAPDWADAPWELFLPGLSEDRARKILSLIEEAGLSFGGEVFNPRWHFSIGGDRATAQYLKAALSDHDSRVINFADTGMEWISPAEARDRVDAITDLLDEFLATGEHYPAEDEEARRLSLVSDATPTFVIEDERHAELIGAFRSREEAMDELHRLARLPWDEEPNRAPCTGWAGCGRSYELLEYDMSREPWHEISRSLMLVISADGVRWQSTDASDS